MGLETGTYVGELVDSNPTAADGVSQGDDHLRLIKHVLQNTFPGANKPFAFPNASSVSANTLLTSEDVNSLIVVNASGGPRTITLPNLSAANAGAEIVVMKSDTSNNRVFVKPPSGPINGLENGVVLGITGEIKSFWWTGSTWVAQPDPIAIGTIDSFAGETVPQKYLNCDGAAVSRSTYEALFAVIGTVWGAGNGSTTFNVPDLRGQVLAGIDEGTGRLSGFSNISDWGGQQNVTLTTAQLPSHSHGSGSLAGGSHSHGSGSLATNSTGAHTHGSGSLGTNSAGAHTHLYWGENDRISYTPGSTTPGLWRGDKEFNTSSAGAHSHSISGSTASAGNHSHSISGSTANSTVSISGSTANAGSGNSHTNVQPTTAVRHIVYAGA